MPFRLQGHTPCCSIGRRGDFDERFFLGAAIFGLRVFGVPNLSAQVHDRDSNPYWDDPRDRDDDERNSPSATELVALTEKWNFVER